MRTCLDYGETFWAYIHNDTNPVGNGYRGLGRLSFLGEPIEGTIVREHALIQASRATFKRIY